MKLNNIYPQKKVTYVKWLAIYSYPRNKYNRLAGLNHQQPKYRAAVPYIRGRKWHSIVLPNQQVGS